MPDGYTFTEHDVAALTDAELALDAELMAVQRAEELPGDPPVPVDRYVAGVRSVPARTKRHAVRAWSTDGTLVGLAGCRIDPEHDTTPDLLEATVYVRPDHRRRGVGVGLVDRLAAYARSEIRNRLVTWSTSSVLGSDEFAQRLGARAVGHTSINHLPVAAVDRAQLDRWVEDGPRRAPGYELLAWDGPTPDEHLGAFADVYAVMNDAPLGDLEHNDTKFTPALIREWELSNVALGNEAWTLVARANDGTFVGLHTVSWAAWRPTVVNVADTGVRREHRGHALGKWLKAAMTLRIVDERPTVTEIVTGNDTGNAAMLGINTAMGYRLKMSATTWELTID
jgi:L-amino acid N-acyltransferase YncA